MTIKTAIKDLLLYKGIKQYQLGKEFNMSPQGFNNKLRDARRWSALDLLKVAEVTGCELAFILPDGNKLILSGPPEGEARHAPKGGET